MSAGVSAAQVQVRLAISVGLLVIAHLRTAGKEREREEVEFFSGGGEFVLLALGG